VFMLIAQTEAIKKIRIFDRKTMTLLLIFYFIFIICLLVREQKQINLTKTEYIKTHIDQLLIAYMKEINADKKPFYIFGNHPEYYYLFNQLPPVHMSIILHDIYKPQFPDMEKNLIKEIIRKDISTIIVPYPIDSNYLPFIQLRAIIDKQYTLIKASDTFRIYVKATK